MCFQKLNLSNAFLFAAALENSETCRLILSTIFGKEIFEAGSRFFEHKGEE